jgi:peptidyl-prolyl cis-trans isomerase C
VRSKLVACAALALLSLAACKKAPAAQTAAATGTSTAATPAGSGAPSGGPATPPAPAKPVPAQLPPVLAHVNGEDVKKEDFDRMIKGMEDQAGQHVPPDRRDEIYRNALDQLVTYTLLTQESKARGIKVDDSEIDAKVKTVRDRFPTQQAFEAALKAQGLSVDELRAEARKDLTVSKLVDTEVGTIAGPSDADAKAYYTKNPDKFTQPESVRASHILIRVDEKADAGAKAKAKTTIDTVLKKAKGGEDFGKLAQQYSQDGSAAQGGDLGYFPRGQMVPAFSDVAFALKPGDISGVVTTQFGYHVIKVVDHKPAGVTPYDQLTADNLTKLKQMIEGEKKQEHMNAFIDGLKKKAKIEVLI